MKILWEFSNEKVWIYFVIIKIGKWFCRFGSAWDPSQGSIDRRSVWDGLRENGDPDLAVHRSVTKGEDAKICQSYVQLRNLIQEWTLAIVSSNRSRKTRIITTSRIIIFNLIENIDLFLKQRLKNISKITDLNMLDKDSLKNLSHGSKIKGSSDTSKISRRHKILYNLKK